MIKRNHDCTYFSTTFWNIFCDLSNIWQRRNAKIRRKGINAMTSLYIFNKESPWEGCTPITQICGKLILYKIVYGTIYSGCCSRVFIVPRLVIAHVGYK